MESESISDSISLPTTRCRRSKIVIWTSIDVKNTTNLATAILARCLDLLDLFIVPSAGCALKYMITIVLGSVLASDIET